MQEIQEVYAEDNTPWVIGFSGGKDSTAVLQLTFYALSKLPKSKLKKEVHVICNDTLVENPKILEYVDGQLKRIRKAGKSGLFKHKPGLFNVAKVTPKLEDSFWVNLIGKGYPSPNRWFRWCTERLKINPTSDYVKETAAKAGKTIIVLGTRKAESANRALSMSKYDNGERLREHKLPNTFVYAPIADLSNNDVWAYLLQAPNPWGSENRGLLELYRGACTGGECPFVVEIGTQSCGKSRFGCWVCTVVDRDRAMENIIANGGKEYKGLLGFRNWIYEIRQQDHQYVPNRLKKKAKFGAFLLKTRKEILRRLLRVQKRLGAELISDNELSYINELLGAENATNGTLKRFTFRVANGKEYSAIADFNILKTQRIRLGPIYLKNARLNKTKPVTDKYEQLSRVLYYEV